MGDLHPGAVAQSLDSSAAGLAHDEHQDSSSMSGSMPGNPFNNTPFYSQHNSMSQGQFRPDLRLHALSTNPQYLGQDANRLNMGSMAGALPEYAPLDAAQNNLQAHQHGQRPLSGASTTALIYHIQQQQQQQQHQQHQQHQHQQNLQMSSHPPGSLPAQSPYGSTFGQGQYQHNYLSSQSPQHPNYGHFPPNQQRMAGPNSMPNPYPHYPQPSQYIYYPSPYGGQAQISQGFLAQGAQPHTVYGRRPSVPNAQTSTTGQNMDLSQHEIGFPVGNRLNSGGIQGDMGHLGHMYGGAFMPPVMNRPGPVSSIPRGPPRKPKQSGHALWVGNLPPGTTVVALKDHFSRDATKDIESLFLISKSNCAFVNYRTEVSCAAAMHRFHDSRFHGVRLVCRLRRSSAPASGVPTGPSAMLGNRPRSTTPPKSPQNVDGEETQGDTVDSPTLESSEESRLASNASEKYFIVKSLTLQDLELSVRNGIWATQSHNEESLNKAYHSAENVYLIFSANKSGEYFGYSRMTSPILEDATQFVPPAPKPENILDSPDVPKSIPTPATEFAPKGRIIDDSARGTIFWEAQLSDSEEDGDQEKELSQIDADASTVAQSWGKPFKVEWISTNRLPFYRTRGLRNPWNANREVKIARDGTELETSVGERLIQMFHRLGPSSVVAPMVQPAQLSASQMRLY